MTDNIIVPKKVSKSDLVYGQMKEDIVSGKLKAGEPLFERQLCTHYGVSRTPIRDALKRLALEKFVETSPSYGTFVAKITSDVILETYNIREVLEGLACRLYTKKITPAEKRELKKLNDKLVHLMKNKAYKEAVKVDISFHEKIMSGCGSATLIGMLSPIAEQINRITYSTHYDDDDTWTEETVRLHTAICEAIINDDAATAESKMREHIAISRNHHVTTLL